MTTETPTQTEPLAAVPDDAELVTAAEQAEQDAVTGREYVGFVGCPKVGLLKVRAHSRERHNMEVACACGEVHVTADPMIRERQPGEIVVLIEEGTPMQVGDDPAPEDARPRPAAPKPDSTILDAIPDDWTLATEVAETLGYGNRMSFINRVREMRERGAPIDTRKEHRAAPMYVRRAVKSD